MSFAESAFLAGILTVAIPFIIHLLDRRKAPRLLFPSLRFLEEVSLKEARRNRIHHWVVLILRASALAALAAALAGPHLRGGSAGQGKASRVLVVDNSMSMDARRGGASALERSLVLAREILREMPADQRAAVLPLHGPADFAPALTENHGELERVLTSVRPTHRASPLGDALQRARRIIEEGTEPAREILFFTDLQASAFEGETEPPAVPDGWSLIILRPAEAEGSNQAVASGEILESGKRGAIVRCVVRGYGPGESLVRSRLVLDGKAQEEKFLRVAQGGESPATFSLPDLAPGLHRLEVRIDDDALPADNSLELVAAGPGAVRVLVARDVGLGGGSRDPAFYLQSALLPGRAGREHLQIHLAETRKLSEADLSRADLAFCLEPSALEPGAAAALAAFVLRGGGLFVSAGPGQPPDLAALLAGDPRRTGALSFGDIVAAEREPFRIARWEERHPVWAPLLSASVPLGPDVPFFTAYRKMIPGPGAQVLAAFSTGDPALVTFRSGRGKVLCFASGLSLEWGNLPLRFLFAPWIHSMVRFLSLHLPETEELLPGSPLVLRHAPEEGFTEAVIEAPGEPSRTVMPVRAKEPDPAPGDRSRQAAGAQPTAGWLVADARTLEKPGIYLVTEVFREGKRREEIRRRLLSVKPLPAESDLSPLGPQRLSEILPGARVISYSSTGEALAELRAASAGMDLKRPLLLAAGALLVLEGLLASLSALRRRDVRSRGPGKEGGMSGGEARP